MQLRQRYQAMEKIIESISELLIFAQASKIATSCNNVQCFNRRPAEGFVWHDPDLVIRQIQGGELAEVLERGGVEEAECIVLEHPVDGYKNQEYYIVY
jgi:hypothetical protein